MFNDFVATWYVMTVKNHKYVCKWFFSAYILTWKYDENYKLTFTTEIQDHNTETIKLVWLTKYDKTVYNISWQNTWIAINSNIGMCIFAIFDMDIEDDHAYQDTFCKCYDEDW